MICRLTLNIDNRCMHLTHLWMKHTQTKKKCSGHRAADDPQACAQNPSHILGNTKTTEAFGPTCVFPTMKQDPTTVPYPTLLYPGDSMRQVSRDETSQGSIVLVGIRRIGTALLPTLSLAYPGKPEVLSVPRLQSIRFTDRQTETVPFWFNFSFLPTRGSGRIQQKEGEGKRNMDGSEAGACAIPVRLQ